MRAKAIIPFVWMLMAVLLSYSLDAECLLNLEGTCWQTCLQDSDDSCVQPPLLAGAPPALPSTSFQLELQVEAEPEQLSWPDLWHPPAERCSLAPVGLRAPPLSA